MIVLCLETSAKSCSVAIGTEDRFVALKESADVNYSHAENLTIYIQQAISEAKISLNDIDAVAVSKGPGSFTGLRIGVSTAKGLCYALNKPLLAVNTLEAMAAGRIFTGKFPANSLFCPMLDAKRMEVYYAIYDNRLHEIKATSAEVIDGNSFSGLLRKNPIYFFGDGAQKIKPLRPLGAYPNFLFIENIFPSAQHLIPLAVKRFREKLFENLACFEPFYLKDFVGRKKPD